MPSKLICAATAIAAALPALGQSPPPATALPDSTIFRFFFIHVMALETAADRLKAQGLEDDSMRQKLASEAALTGKEAALVKDVARSCNTDYESASRAAVAVARDLQKQYPNRATAPPSVAAQVSALEAQRAQVITNCIETLQAGMPPSRFQMLHDWVVANEAPHITQGTSTTQPPK
jgi:hypothetical protein